MAAIGMPTRFFDDLKHLGVDVRTTMTFPDHHPFSRHDVEAIAARARAARCTAVLTTEKDAMRLRRFRPLPVPIYVVPMTVSFEPSERFEGWVADHLAYVRARRRAA